MADWKPSKSYLKKLKKDFADEDKKKSEAESAKYGKIADEWEDEIRTKARDIQASSPTGVDATPEEDAQYKKEVDALRKKREKRKKK